MEIRKSVKNVTNVRPENVMLNARQNAKKKSVIKTHHVHTKKEKVSVPVNVLPVEKKNLVVKKQRKESDFLV